MKNFVTKKDFDIFVSTILFDNDGGGLLVGSSHQNWIGSHPVLNVSAADHAGLS